jgi:hypothetical protein
MGFGKISIAVVTPFVAPTAAAAFQAVDTACLHSTVSYVAEGMSRAKRALGAENAAGIIGGIIIPGTT